MPIGRHRLHYIKGSVSLVQEIKGLDHPVKLKFAKTQTAGYQVMAIVTIGNLPQQVPEQGSPDFVHQLVKQIEGDITDLVGRFVNESLETEVKRYLRRGRYRWWKKAKRQEQGAYCSKCKSHQRQGFRRNGHYRRNLVTHWGQISVNLPQVKCQCGGNVKMKYQTVRSRQRTWDDVKVEVLAEYGRGLSYRQIKVDLD
jgi:hypothetical protein